MLSLTVLYYVGELKQYAVEAAVALFLLAMGGWLARQDRVGTEPGWVLIGLTAGPDPAPPAVPPDRAHACLAAHGPDGPAGPVSSLPPASPSPKSRRLERRISC